MRLRLIFYILLLFPLGIHALYNGNPAFPTMPEEGIFIAMEDWLGVKIGYELDWVYYRKIRLEGEIPEHCRKKAGHSHSLDNLGVVTINFIDRVEMFGTLGTLSFDISHHPFSGKKISYHSKSRFAWGVGGRAILAYWGELQLSANASYLDSEPFLSSLRVNNKSYPVQGAHADYREWQIGIGTSYTFHWFIPYVGVDYSDFRTRIDSLDSIGFLIPSKHVTFENSCPFGIYLGFGLASYRAFNMNVEARFISENALSLSADFRF